MSSEHSANSSKRSQRPNNTENNEKQNENVGKSVSLSQHQANPSPESEINKDIKKNAGNNDIFPLPVTFNHDLDFIPVSKWTRPTFLERNFSERKKQRFNFNYDINNLAPIEINLGNCHFRWVDGFWFNLGTDYEAACVDMTEEKKEHYLKENDELKLQIEILLDINTNYEIKKAHLREKLTKLEEEIRSFPGVIPDSDSGLEF